MHRRSRLSVMLSVLVSVGSQGIQSPAQTATRSFASLKEVPTRIPIDGPAMPKWSGSVLVGVENGYSQAPILYSIDN